MSFEDKTLNPGDAISGKEGRAWIKTPDGNIETLFMIKNIEATLEYAVSEIKAIGRRMTGHKVTGCRGSGSATLYYMTPIFRKHAMDYKATGIAPEFNLTIINDDPASAAGRQTAYLYGVLLNKVLLSKLDADSDDTLEEDFDFVFSDCEIPEQFNLI